MKRLAKLEEDEVGDINDIVDRLQAYAHKLFLKPLRRRGHLYALDGHATVARSTLGIEQLDVQAALGAVGKA